MSSQALKVNQRSGRAMPAVPGAAVDAITQLLAPAHLAFTTGRPDAVLFDLDGVLVDTAEWHYIAWKHLADELGLQFDRQAYEAFRGVARPDCVEKLLGRHSDVFAAEERRVLGDRKNEHYRQLIATLSPDHLVPGARMLLGRLRDAGIPMAIVSSSRNAREVIARLGITGSFGVVVDGAMVHRSKPDPEGFLRAAEILGARPPRCVVVEDAEAGIRAALTAGMKTVGIGGRGSTVTAAAHVAVKNLAQITPDMLRLEQ